MKTPIITKCLRLSKAKSRSAIFILLSVAVGTGAFIHHPLVPIVAVGALGCLFSVLGLSTLTKAVRDVRRQQGR